MPYEWDMCKKLGYNCGLQRQEYEEEDLEPIDQVCEKPCPGNPDMFEAKDLAVCQPEKYLAPGKKEFLICLPLITLDIVTQLLFRVRSTDAQPQAGRGT
jgi:hypothetical protein